MDLTELLWASPSEFEDSTDEERDELTSILQDTGMPQKQYHEALQQKCQGRGGSQRNLAADKDIGLLQKAADLRAAGLVKIQSVIKHNASLAGLIAVLDTFLNIMATSPETTPAPGTSKSKHVTHFETALLQIYPGRTMKGGKTTFACSCVQGGAEQLVRNRQPTLTKSILSWSTVHAQHAIPLPNLKYL